MTQHTPGSARAKDAAIPFRATSQQNDPSISRKLKCLTYYHLFIEDRNRCVCGKVEAKAKP